MPKRAKVEYPVSAGGVVCRRTSDGLEVVLCGRLKAGTWSLPKGTPDDGESIEQTALREVREETGLDATIDEPLGTIEYWFAAPGGSVRYHKRVHYFLMTATGGSMDDHDPEFDIVRWFPAERAMVEMTYDNEIGVVRRAVDRASLHD